MLAADFFVAPAATCRVLHIFVVVEVGAPRLVRCNGTAHSTAAWTFEQFQEVPAEGHPY